MEIRVDWSEFGKFGNFGGIQKANEWRKKHCTVIIIALLRLLRRRPKLSLVFFTSPSHTHKPAIAFLATHNQSVCWVCLWCNSMKGREKRKSVWGEKRVLFASHLSVFSISRPNSKGMRKSWWRFITFYHTETFSKNRKYSEVRIDWSFVEICKNFYI